MQGSLTIEQLPEQLRLTIRSGLDATVPSAIVEVDVVSAASEVMAWAQHEVVGLECDWLPSWAVACVEAYLWGSDPKDVTDASRRLWRDARKRLNDEPALATKQHAWRDALKQRRGASGAPRRRYLRGPKKPTS